MRPALVMVYIYSDIFGQSIRHASSDSYGPDAEFDESFEFRLLGDKFHPGVILAKYPNLQQSLHNSSTPNLSFIRD